VEREGRRKARVDGGGRKGEGREKGEWEGRSTKA
jgi:hypothetical protein